MWILKNSTNLVSSLGHLGVHRATSIQTCDFSTLCTSIPHDLLKSHMNNIRNNAFKHKNGATLARQLPTAANILSSTFHLFTSSSEVHIYKHIMVIVAVTPGQKFKLATAKLFYCSRKISRAS